MRHQISRPMQRNFVKPNGCRSSWYCLFTANDFFFLNWFYNFDQIIPKIYCIFGYIFLYRPRPRQRPSMNKKKCMKLSTHTEKSYKTKLMNIYYENYFFYISNHGSMTKIKPMHFWSFIWFAIKKSKTDRGYNTCLV